MLLVCVTTKMYLEGVFLVVPLSHAPCQDSCRHGQPATKLTTRPSPPLTAPIKHALCSSHHAIAASLLPKCNDPDFPRRENPQI
jgi:hypothetical protein